MREVACVLAEGGVAPEQSILQGMQPGTHYLAQVLDLLDNFIVVLHSVNLDFDSALPAAHLPKFNRAFHSSPSLRVKSAKSRNKSRM